MQKAEETKQPLKEPLIYVPKFTVNRLHPYKGMSLKQLTVDEKEEKNKFMTTAVAAAEGQVKTVQNAQTATVALFRKIELIHYVQDPYTTQEKELMEAAGRRNFAVRVSLWIRELSAFKKSKLVIELPDDVKADLTDDEISKQLEPLKKNTAYQNILRKFRVRDKNLKLPAHAKTLAIQNWLFGRGLIIIYYKDQSYKEIKKLMPINSRRLGEPVLDEKEDLTFEGCLVDGQGLDKDSMIYATYFAREISPHSEGHGYSPTEPIIYTAQAHNVLLEEDSNEIVKSAWLPSILLPIITSGMTGANKNTQISRIIDGIDPAKILGVDAESLGGDAQVLDMKPDFTGLREWGDSLEEKIYNNYHIPLFLVKSDKIANLATAQKSAQMFIEGTVSDDQVWMEEILAEQWYDPLLREELKQAGALKTTANPQAKPAIVDTSQPTDAEAPLPFVIRRRYEKPRIEDLIEMSQVVTVLKRDGVIDLQKALEMLGMENITGRMQKANEERQKMDMEFQQTKIDNEKKNMEVKTASLDKQSDKEIIITQTQLKKEQLKQKNLETMKKIAENLA